MSVVSSGVAVRTSAFLCVKLVIRFDRNVMSGLSVICHDDLVVCLCDTGCVSRYEKYTWMVFYYNKKVVFICNKSMPGTPGKTTKSDDAVVICVEDLQKDQKTTEFLTEGLRKRIK